MSLTPSSTAPPHRGDVSRSEFHQGCILFLKKREHILDTHWRLSGVNEEGLRHPALVVQKEGLRSDQIIICLLTTFHGRSVDQRFPLPKHHWKRAKYLPVHPQKPLVRGGIQLLLANGVKMNKPGYVNIGRIYTVHISMLRKYDWDFPADHYQLCKQSLANVLSSIYQHHAGLTIIVETASPLVTPSIVAMPRQGSMGSSMHTAIDIDSLSGQRTGSYPGKPPTHHKVTTVDRLPSDRTPLLKRQHIPGSNQTLPRYTSCNESVPHTYARPDRSSHTILDFFGSIARNIGLVFSWVLELSLQFLRRNCGVIFFLLTACAVGVGAVFGTIWFINVLYRRLGAAGHWVTNEWRLILNTGTKVKAAVAHFIHSAVKAVMRG